MADADPAQAAKQREAFIRAFQSIAIATENLTAITKKQIELTNVLINSVDGLVGSLVAPKDGLRDVLDDLIEEVRALRVELRRVRQ